MILIYAAAALVAGIALAALLLLPIQVWLWLLVLPLGYLAIWWRDPKLRRVHLLALALVLGALRYELALPGPLDQTLAQFNDRGRISLLGTIIAEPDPRETLTNLRVDVSKVQVGGEWQNTRGRALVQVPRDAPVRYGDEIQVDGEATTPPASADFSYREFLARESIFTQVRYARVYVVAHDRADPFWASVLGFKAAALDAVKMLLPEPAAALLSGILLGHDQEIPRSLKDAFSRTNTAHIIAISGFNIAIIAIYLGKVLRRAFGEHSRVANGLVIAALVFYTLLVGASASVVRAAIMGGVGVLALQFRRQAFALNSLGLAALVMLLLNPFTLWDSGFQLSFLATLGLLLYTERMTKWFEHRLSRRTGDERAKKIVGFLSDSFIVTLAAQFTTTPLIVATFHRLSIIGVLTNLLILPVQPGVMVFGGLATLVQVMARGLAATPILATVIGAVGQVLAWCAYVCLQYTILIVQWTASVPFASIEVPRLDWALVVIIYILIFLLTRFSLKQVTGVFFSRPAVAAGLLAFVTIFIWTTSLAAPDPRTHLQFIATAGGDSILIRSSNGARILIDGSAEPTALLGQLGNQTTYWDRRIDLIVATHLDEQNLASLNSVLERYTVARVLEPPAPTRMNASYQKWRELIAERGIATIEARVGTQVRVDEVLLDVLAPEADDASLEVALRVAAGSHKFLLAPALSMTGSKKLTASNGDLSAEATVLPRTFDTQLIERIKPHYAVLFVGRSIREQPDPEVLKSLEGTTLLRTDERGTVEFVLDGDELALRAER